MRCSFCGRDPFVRMHAGGNHVAGLSHIYMHSTTTCGIPVDRPRLAPRLANLEERCSSDHECPAMIAR